MEETNGNNGKPARTSPRMINRHFNIRADQNEWLIRQSNKLYRRGKLIGQGKQKKPGLDRARSELLRRLIDWGMQNPDLIVESEKLFG
jgi:hypothetical protein